MAAALTQDPLSLVKLKRTPYGFLMKGTRWREGVPARTSEHEHDDLVRIELVHEIGDGDPRLSNPNTEGDGSQDETE